MDYDVSKPKPQSRKIMEGCAVAVILSMVIGNMFVARRMKSFMKAKVPSWEGAKKSAGHETSHSHTQQETSSSSGSSQESSHFKNRSRGSASETGEQASYRWAKTKANLNTEELPLNLIRSLSLLGLPYYPVPSITSVKNAYYRLARQYHPDRFPSDHPEKKAYENKFKNISLAYKECLEKLPTEQGQQAQEPAEKCASLKDICERLSIGGRIRVAAEGSNGIIGGSAASIVQFKELFASLNGVEEDVVQWYQSGLVSTVPYQDQAFTSLSVQLTKEVVSLDLKPEVHEEVTTVGAGTYLTPQEFHAMLTALDKSKQSKSTIGGRRTNAGLTSETTDIASSSGSNRLLDSQEVDNFDDEFELLDIRNHYEVRIGTFMGDSFTATNPETRQFSDIARFFDERAEALRGKKVLMYCTGGVRCERASAYLKLRGVRDVYHLRGGIHAYQSVYGDSGYFKGKNFVFDPRIAISNRDAASFANQSTEQTIDAHSHECSTSKCNDTVLGQCLICSTEWDDYSPRHRCRSCRMLILVCSECVSKTNGTPLTVDCELCRKRSI